MLIVIGIVLALFAGFSAIKEKWGLAAAIVVLIIYCIISTIVNG